MTNKLVLLSLLLLSTPVWAECETLSKTCADKCGYGLEPYTFGTAKKSCLRICEAQVQLCEIKEILKELVKK